MTLTKAEIDGVVVGKVLDELEYHRFSVKYGGLLRHASALKPFTIFSAD